MSLRRSSAFTPNADTTFFPRAAYLTSPSSTHLSEVSLQELYNSFRLSKTGNKAMLIERLEKFSTDQKDWDM